MQVVKVGPKGHVSIPAGILRELRIREGAMMVAEIHEDGGILLRQAVVHPVEIYSGARIREFEEENRMSAAERRVLARREGQDARGLPDGLSLQARLPDGFADPGEDGCGKLLVAVMGSQEVAKPGTPAAGDAVLAEIVRRLVEAYDPEGVYLFGSTARGDAGPDSDYDLLVVVPDDAPKERKQSRLAYEVLRGTGVAADVLVCTHSYFEQRRHLKASLPGTVLREGKKLHGA